MMNLTIKKEVPIKYHLNMHLMESLLDKDSVAFEIIRYIINDKKELNLDSFKFTSKTLKYIFGDKMKDEKFKEYIITELKALIASSKIVASGKTMHLSKEIIENFYNID